MIVRSSLSDENSRNAYDILFFKFTAIGNEKTDSATFVITFNKL